MRITILFKGGHQYSDIEARYFTVYPHASERQEPEIHIETLEGTNLWFRLAVIESISTINK